MILTSLNNVNYYPNGREVCQNNRGGKKEYKRRVEVMRNRQGEYCCLCHLPLAETDATFEHQDGRGMNGGHRDDRIEKDGKPYNGAAHRWCNSEKGSRRTTYQ